MCGLCGVIRPAAAGGEATATVAAINGLQGHRGPDGTGSWPAEHATLGHTRLAIVDLTDGGRQPFRSADGRVGVVFNGEIYNHADLRQRYRLTTVDRCDGAILPELWELLGTSMFGELRGMYAIAVHDTRTGTTTLARDPFGIKPLCWTRITDGVAFASEPRALLPLLAHTRLAEGAVRRYLRNGATDRDETAFDGVECVPANGWIQWDAVLVRTYGTVHCGLFDRLPDSGPRELRAAFLRSVSAHLCSDVPVALLLSSGLDSAAIAWACAELGLSVTCVTVDLGADMGERDRAAGIAARFGHPHEVLSAVPDAALVRRYFAMMQRPSIDGLNTFLVSRAISGIGVKVALSGLGGDEVLAGYQSFRLLRYLPLLRAADLLGLDLARRYGGANEKVALLLGRTGPRDATGLGALLRRVLLDPQVDALLPPHAPGPPPGAVDRDDGQPALALSRAELTGYLGGTLLPDTDAFSMAWSVEMRVPYVDVTFARTALAVDPRRGVGKRRFAACLDDAELRRIARRPKCGFALPMDAWMRDGPLTSFVEATRARDAPVRELLRPGAVDELLDGWRSGRLGWSRAWATVALDAWLRSLADVGTPAGLPSGVRATSPELT